MPHGDKSQRAVGRLDREENGGQDRSRRRVTHSVPRRLLGWPNKAGEARSRQSNLGSEVEVPLLNCGEGDGEETCLGQLSCDLSHELPLSWIQQHGSRPAVVMREIDCLSWGGQW